MDPLVSPDKKKEADASKAKSDSSMGAACQECAAKKKVAKIVKIDWLDDADATIAAKKLLGAKGTQFVNLPREDKFVDGTIVKTKDRLSNKPRFRVEFDQPGAHSFKVKLIPGGSNAAYSATEKTRNPKFTHEATERSYTTEADGTKVADDIQLAVAGNDSYTLQATDDQGNKVKSSELVTQRLMYYINVKMRDLASVAANTNGFKSEFKNHFIQFEELASVSMDRIANVGTDSGPLLTAARTVYEASTAPAKEGHVIAVIYTDHLAVKNPNQSIIKSSVDVGPGKPAVVVPIAGPGLTNPATNTRYLWRDIVPGEGWFVSAKYTPDGGGADVVIPEAKCSALPADSSYRSRVSVNVTELPAGTGSITLAVNWVDRMRGGLSFPGGNAVCICTRAWWANVSTDDQNQVLVHEVGHQVGMVANGTGILPDKVSTHYDSSKGHVGDHCYQGIADGQARYDSAADATASRCVMYGATNSRIAFCANCAPAVRKVDITNAIVRF
jgi:hypothetical protein